MNIEDIAKKLVAPGKGILAADESIPTMAKRLALIDTESVAENRYQYHEWIFTTSGINEYLSGVIMFDESMHQFTDDGRSFQQAMEDSDVIPGIKVDLGLEKFKDSEVEKITLGIDTLDARLKEYSKLGAKFTKWRAVFNIGTDLPSDECILENAKLLAKYAQIAQVNNMVPIVEPEVLTTGHHDIDRCYEVTKKVLTIVFEEIANRGVNLNAMLLKPNMVLPGSDFSGNVSSKEIGEKTVSCLKESVPNEVPGIVFLSGGQTEQDACENLNEIVKAGADAPWELSFSYGRALQRSALEVWGGKVEQEMMGQQAFLERAKLVSLARQGKYDASVEHVTRNT